MTGDAFDMLGLPATFDLTPGVLQAAYLSRSRLLHPDAAGSAPGRDPDDAEVQRRAAELNDAKRTLDNPLSRAELLLRRLGGGTGDADQTLPPAFLMQMLETREAIEAAINARDLPEVERWQDWAAARRREHIASVAAHFAFIRGEARTPVPIDDAARHECRRAIRAELARWRYIERLIEHLDAVAMD